MFMGMAKKAADTYVHRGHLAGGKWGRECRTIATRGHSVDERKSATRINDK